MNNARRKKLEAIRQRLAALVEQGEQIKIDVEEVRDEEQEYLDNMPPSLADAQKGEAAQAAIDALDNLIMDLDSLIDHEGFTESLDTAIA